MSVTISQAEAAVAIRAASAEDTIAAPVTATLKFLFPAAVKIVELHASAAPDEVHNVALIRLLGWLWEAEPSDPRISRAMQVSGAAPLLSQWRTHRAGAIGPVGQATPTAGGGGAPGANLPPAPPFGNYILSIKDGVLTWVEFPAP